MNDIVRKDLDQIGLSLESFMMSHQGIATCFDWATGKSRIRKEIEMPAHLHLCPLGVESEANGDTF